MQTDALFKFDVTPHSLTGTSDVLSTNVADIVTAAKLLETCGPMQPYLFFSAKITGGTTPTIRARLVGADDAGLTTNPIILADTGVISVDDAGGALASGDLVTRCIKLGGQKIAKRYYGVIFIMTGTSPTADVIAVIVTDPQTNMPANKAAVP